jgi:hypothetical protein
LHKNAPVTITLSLGWTLAPRGHELAVEDLIDVLPTALSAAKQERA